MRKLSCLLLSVSALATASPASALQFVLNMDPSISADYARGIDIAAAYWSSVLTDDVTITLDLSVGHAFNGGGSLGASQVILAPPTDWGTARALLASDASTPLDAQAVASLNLHPDLDSVTSQFSPAVAKAIGLTGYSGIDGVIEFADDITFDFDPSDGVQTNDFLAVALHEFGHALGFDPNFLGATTLDMFRYTAPGEVASALGTAGSYFSIDDGASELFGDAEFGVGHWPGPMGIMNYGGVSEVTALDLAAFDAMGWDLNFDILADPGYRYTTADIFRDFSVAAVPEPAAWLMMIAGFCAVGAALRRTARRRLA